MSAGRALGLLGLALGSLLGLTPPSTLLAQDGAPVPEGAPFLLLPLGAQAVALGRAMTAVPGAEAVFWNPAGLATLEGSHLELFRGNNFAVEQFGAAVLGKAGGLGTVGLTYGLTDVGEGALTDETGQVLGSITVRSHVATASFATGLVSSVDAGVNVKLAHFRQSCRGQCSQAGVSSTSVAFDLGLLAHPGDAFRLGVMVAHLGPKVQFINAEQADPLPTRLRVAGAYEIIRQWEESGRFQLWMNLEMEDRWHDLGDPSLYLGSELQVGTDEALFVRAGYVFRDLDQRRGAALGLGLRYDRFNVAIARSLAAAELSPDTEPVYVTLGIAF
ncbi:MAG: PorV/PorQ family protein [Gemmatimonadetes bacterium]|nr:PorV/PorQ family protein [Gemmatimonadota bacterium]